MAWAPPTDVPLPAMRGPNGRGPGPARGMRGQRGTDGPMTEEAIEHVLEIAAEIDPELAERLQALCASDPEGFDRIIRRQGRRLGALVEMRESDPALFEVKVSELKIDAEIRELAETIRAARAEHAGEDVMAAEMEGLRGLMRARIALGMRAQHLYIERLEQHLATMRTRLDGMADRFNELVEERLERLLESEPRGEDQVPAGGNRRRDRDS